MQLCKCHGGHLVTGDQQKGPRFFQPNFYFLSCIGKKKIRHGHSRLPRGWDSPTDEAYTKGLTSSSLGRYNGRSVPENQLSTPNADHVRALRAFKGSHRRQERNARGQREAPWLKSPDFRKWRSPYVMTHWYQEASVAVLHWRAEAVWTADSYEPVLMDHVSSVCIVSGTIKEQHVTKAISLF